MSTANPIRRNTYDTITSYQKICVTREYIGHNVVRHSHRTPRSHMNPNSRQLRPIILSQQSIYIFIQCLAFCNFSDKSSKMYTCHIATFNAYIGNSNRNTSQVKYSLSFQVSIQNESGHLQQPWR